MENINVSYLTVLLEAHRGVLLRNLRYKVCDQAFIKEWFEDSYPTLYDVFFKNLYNEEAFPLLALAHIKQDVCLAKRTFTQIATWSTPETKSKLQNIVELRLDMMSGIGMMVVAIDNSEQVIMDLDFREINQWTILHNYLKLLYGLPIL